jgi:FPC/CPF motif-containing protein YcgG
MVDEGLAREIIGCLGTAAAVLIEDVHLDLLTSPTDIDAARNIAAILQRIGTDLDALGAAAAVLAQRSK